MPMPIPLPTWYVHTWFQVAEHFAQPEAPFVGLLPLFNPKTKPQKPKPKPTPSPNPDPDPDPNPNRTSLGAHDAAQA